MVLYRDVPGSDAEMVRRIGDADAVLLSYTSRMGKEVIAQCPNIRYIGMCCSLYSEESANVDIAYARTRGIQVLGIRDYGDRGGSHKPNGPLFQLIAEKTKYIHIHSSLYKVDGLGGALFHALAAAHALLLIHPHCRPSW